MSMLDDIVTAYGFDKLDALTKYPNILPLHEIKDNHATTVLTEANYQPVPPHPENMEIVMRELIDGEIIRILVLDNDYFVGNRDEIVHARGDRIIVDPRIIPMYRSLMNFFNANMSNNERLMVLYGVVYGGRLKGNERYVVNNGDAKCVLVDGFTMKVQDVVGICRDNNIDVISDWVDTLHQPFWSVKTLSRFCDTCNLEQLPNLLETTLDKIPTNPELIKPWSAAYEKTNLAEKEPEKPKRKPGERDPQADFEPEIDPLPKKSLEDILNEVDDKVNINSIMKDELSEDIDELFNPSPKINDANKFQKSKGVVVRALDRTYIRKIEFDKYL